MGIFFAIFSPFLDSVSNYIDKFLLEKHDLLPISITIYTTCISLVVGVSLFLIMRPSYPDGWSAFIIICSGILTTLYLVPYFKALSLDDASTVMPLAQLVPVFVLLLSFILLGEKLLLLQYIGAACIIFAGFLLTIEKKPSGIFRIRPAFFYMVFATFLFALSLILYKFGVREISFWETLPLESIGTGIGTVSLLFYGKNFSSVKKQTKKLPKNVFIFIAITEGLFLVARYCAYYALSVIPASIMSILAGFQPVFVLAIGLVLSLWFPDILSEVIDKKTISIKVIAILFIFSGLFLIFH